VCALASKPAQGDSVINTYYRVLYGDTDAMGIVYNGNYFRLFEQGRGEYLRAKGCDYASIEARGIRTLITEGMARYYHPFRYDDYMRIETWVTQIKKASFRFEYRLFRDPEDIVMVAGHTLHAVLNPEGKVVKLPDWLLDVLA
jgi:acyl-CoA thioester hydrolase